MYIITRSRDHIVSNTHIVYVDTGVKYKVYPERIDIDYVNSLWCIQAIKYTGLDFQASRMDQS